DFPELHQVVAGRDHRSKSELDVLDEQLRALRHRIRRGGDGRASCVHGQQCAHALEHDEVVHFFLGCMIMSASPSSTARLASMYVSSAHISRSFWSDSPERSDNAR